MTEKKDTQNKGAESVKGSSQSAVHDAEKSPDFQAENKKLAEDLNDLTGTLQRLQAEFENYRKRCDRDNANFMANANESLVKKLLPTLDNFELALSSPKEGDFHKGMELIYAQLIDVLEEEGLKKIDAKGKKFDPKFHEALLVEPSSAEPNTILEELQKGYLFNERVLRHTKVKISKKQ